MENDQGDSDESHGIPLNSESDPDSDDPPNLQLNPKDSKLDGIFNRISLKEILSKRKWTSKSSLQLLTMHSLLIFIATAIPNIQWPFVILYFQNEGSSIISISIYASCMSVFVLITSLCCPKLKKFLPLKHLLILCLASLCLMTCAHGLIGVFEDPTVIVVMGSAIRIGQGISSTVIQVLAVSILINRFPDKSGRVSAVNESALGLGHSLAPLIGGIVYDKVGFLWTFVLLGSLGLVMIIPVLAMPTRKLGSNPSSPRPEEGPEQKVAWFDLLFLSPVIVCTVSVLCESCVEWVMALYIDEMFGEDATLSGLVLSALSLSSILFAFLLGYICDRVNPFLLGVTGCALCALGYLLMVPPPALGIPVTKATLLSAAVVAGFGSAMIWLHIMPAMLFVKRRCRESPVLLQGGGVDGESPVLAQGRVDGRLSDLVSLLYAVGISVGETAGSYIAGVLETWCNYWQFFTILAATMALTTLCTALCYTASRRSICRAARSLSSSSSGEEMSGDRSSPGSQDGVTLLSNGGRELV